MVCVRAYPRIHIALLDLGNATYRKYGGAGFYISTPRLEVQARPSDETSVRGLDKLDRQGQRDLLAALTRLGRVHGYLGAEVVLRRILPQHVGLGSKTALTLAVLKAASLVSGLKLSRSALQRLSGRGGTSGIGINTFFSGGFVVDGGHQGGESEGFLPSSASKAREIPPVIVRSRIPSEWRFHLILPRGRRYAGHSEVSFFSETTPIPKSEVLRSIALVYHGVAVALILKDLALLRRSLRSLHRVGFKRRELENQTIAVQALLSAFMGLPDVAVGLSGVGPLLYVISLSGDEAIHHAIRMRCEHSGARILGVCSGRNSGHEVLA